MATVRYGNYGHGIEMPGLGKPRLCVLGEICLEVHGVLTGDLPSREARKNTALVAELETHLGGCGLFGAVTAMRLEVSVQLIVHVGSEFPFNEFRPSNAQVLDEILRHAVGVRLVTGGSSGVFFSFWQHEAEARVLYGKPGRGLLGTDLADIEINADRVALLSQSDPAVYATIHRAATERDMSVVCAPNKALENDVGVLWEYLEWGDALVISRSEAENYLGPDPEHVLAAADAARKAVVVITAADGDIAVVLPDGSCHPVRLPQKVNAALLGAGDSFATALSCFLDRDTSPIDAVKSAAATMLDVQGQFRPKILGNVPRSFVER